MMKKLIFILCGFAPLATIAQNTADELNKQVHVTRSYEPTINDANKLNIMPKITDTLKLTPNFKYSIFSKPIENYFPVKPIPAAKLVAEPKPELKNFFIRGGLGNYTSTLFDLYYNSPRKEDYSYGMYFTHRASTGKLKLDGGTEVPTNNSQNEVSLFGKKIYDSAILSGSATYGHKKNLFYGYDDNLNSTYVFNKDSLTQYFDHARVDLGLKSFYLDSMHVNYGLNVAYDYYADHFDFTENQVQGQGEVFKYFNKDYLGASLSLLHVGKSGSFDTVSNTVLTIGPMLKKYGSFYTASIGVNFTKDVWGDKDENYFFPVGHLTIDAAGAFFVPYVKIGGYLEVNSYKKITTENPFVEPGLYVENTAHKMVLSGGIKGNVSATVSYNVWGGFELIDHEYFFVNVPGDLNLYNNFSVIYDDMSQTTFGGELSVAVKKYLDLGVRATVYSYKLDNEEKAWGRPSFDASIDATYWHNEKWKFKASVFAVGERFAKSFKVDESPIKLKSFVDLNLGCEYSFTKRLAAFVNVNNLLNSNYDIYYLYPAYRINAMVGASYSF